MGDRSMFAESDVHKEAIGISFPRGAQQSHTGNSGPRPGARGRRRLSAMSIAMSSQGSSSARRVGRSGTRRRKRRGSPDLDALLTRAARVARTLREGHER